MKRVLLFFAVSLLLFSCHRELVILHTNDTHSHLEAERGVDLSGRGGAIERAAYVDSVRAHYGAVNVLLLHAGDWNQGSSYYSEFDGVVEVEVANAMGYDAMTLGNHEFDDGIEDLTRRVKMVKCPIICANLDLRSFELGDYVKPFIILKKAGFKIGIIGLETEMKGKVSAMVTDRIPQYDAVETVNKYSDQLKNQDRCDLVIILSHQGFERDKVIAAASHNVDLIVGGHSHTFLDEVVIVKDLDGKDVRIVQDWQWGLEMGEMHIRL